MHIAIVTCIFTCKNIHLVSVSMTQTIQHFNIFNVTLEQRKCPLQSHLYLLW